MKTGFRKPEIYDNLQCLALECIAFSDIYNNIIKKKKKEKKIIIIDNKKKINKNLKKFKNKKEKKNYHKPFVRLQLIAFV